MVFRVIILLHITCAAFAVNYLYDETVWTKQTWSAYKLQFPAQKLLRAAEHTTGSELVSNLGPFREDSYPQTQLG